VGKDVNMLIGNGYTKDHAKITLQVLRENPSCGNCLRRFTFSRMAGKWGSAVLAQGLANRFRSVSIIGLGKNTGKTFTFNYLLRESRRLGLSTAITSIGLDGRNGTPSLAAPNPRL